MTAFVNGEREGIILEKPLIMGENRRKATYNETSPSLFPRLDIADEVNLASGSCTASKTYDLIKNVKRLGMERLIKKKKSIFLHLQCV